MPAKDKKEISSWPPPLGIGKTHLIIYILGFIVLVIGYLLMSVGPWDNPVSRTYAPLVLLLGYLVIFPLAILWRDKKESRTPSSE